MTYKYTATTSDEAILKQEVMRQWIETRAEELMVGKELVPVSMMSSLDLKMLYPKVTRFDPEEVAEGAQAGFQSFEWYEVTQSMKKEQTRVRVTDESKARMQADVQTRMSMEFAARGLAWSRDTDIFSVLTTGAATSESASVPWDDATADIIGDIAAGIDEILTSTYLTDADIKNIKIAVPMGLWGYLNTPVTTGTMNEVFWSDYIRNKYNIGLLFTRQLTTDALIVVNSPETASHVVYNGNDIPRTEVIRVPAVGEDYYFTHMYKTFIVPESEGGTTNHRIYIIEDVKSS